MGDGTENATMPDIAENPPAPTSPPVQFTLKGLLAIQFLVAIVIWLWIYDSSLGFLIAFALSFLLVGYCFHRINFHGILIALILVSVLLLSVWVNDHTVLFHFQNWNDNPHWKNGVPTKDGLNFVSSNYNAY